MLRALLLIRDLLTREDRRRFLALLPAMAVSSVLDLAVVASSAGFFGLLARPEVISTQPLLAAAYDATGAPGVGPFLALVGAGVFVVVVVGNAFSAWTIRRVYLFSWRQVQSIGERVLASYLNQPYAFFLGHSTSDLAQRVLVEVQSIVDKVVVHLLQTVARLLGALLIVGWLVARDPLLTLLLVAVLGGSYGGLLFVLRGHLFRLGKERLAANQARHRTANESLVGIKEIKLLGLEDEAARRFGGPSRTFADAMARHTILAHLPRYALESVAVGGIVVVVVYLLAIGRPLEGALAMVGTYAVAAYRLLPALQAVFATASHVRFELHALEQIHRDVTSAPSLERPVPAEVTFTRRVELAGVTFRYPTATATLFDGLDLALERGRWTAFVGSTGSGKTTLADLVMGLLLPTSGEVRVDGRALRTTPEVLGWQQHIGYVPQAIFMSDDTVARNIAFGHPDPDRERIRAAARVAAIDEFVEGELASGWDTPVGERGIRLSGGQRQRIGLARALYERPDLLVLDEATSALDNETEKLVMERLRAALRDTTVIMVAHRLSTTRYCDEILLLERGRVADRGTYDELLARSARFRDLVQAAET